MPNYLESIARLVADGVPLPEIAARLHVNVEWIEIVMSSDAYQAFAHDYGNPTKAGGAPSAGEAE